MAAGSHRENPYMVGFLTDIFVRPSCSECPARNYKSGADITMADCWGFEKYHPELDDNRGESLVLIYNKRAEVLFDSLKDRLSVITIPYEEVEETRLHSPLTKSTKPNRQHDRFFRNFNSKDVIQNMEDCIARNNRRDKIISIVKKIATLLGVRYVYRKIKKQ